MITEDYVSFEIAKLLKEKGYKGSFNGYYNNAGCVVDKPNTILKEPKYQYYERVSLYMAMKWLRETYNLHIIALPYAPIDRPPYHPGEADIVYIGQIFKGIIPIDEVGRSIIKLSPEEASEAAIKYCLENLI